MGQLINYTVNSAEPDAIEHHLIDLGAMPLAADRAAYAKKLAERAQRFEAWSAGQLVGLVACYECAVPHNDVYVTHVGVTPSYRRQGIAAILLAQALQFANGRGMELEVEADNAVAMNLYARAAFRVVSGGTRKVVMRRDPPRDFAREHAQPGYLKEFDKRMHGYLLQTFVPWLVPRQVWSHEQVLELGCYEGDFTQRLLEHFPAATCVEAAADALAVARRRLGANVRFHHDTFEDVNLTSKFDNVFLIHALEHVDDPLVVLRRLNDEWLDQRSRAFIAVPNSHAVSRHLAVEMGLIEHCLAVTEAERQHGHQRTYSLDLLKRDCQQAGLRVVKSGGVFFKPLSGEQFDRALAAGIVTPDYLDACYALSDRYPNACNSIYAICEWGEKR